MNKAFTRETDDADDDDVPEGAPLLPQGTRNYMTPAGNGDRSENGDYIYGKKRLREVDRRIRFLVRRLDRAEVVDPSGRAGDDDDDRVYFGATVDVVNAKGEAR